jgi:hypothetical protein
LAYQCRDVPHQLLEAVPVEVPLAEVDGFHFAHDLAHVLSLLDAMEAQPRLKRLRESILFLEQPIARARALAASVEKGAARLPDAKRQGAASGEEIANCNRRTGCLLSRRRITPEEP